MEVLEIRGIKRRLAGSVCLVLIAFLFFLVLAVCQLARLNGFIRKLYDHPLHVSNAALMANGDIVKMHWRMNDVVLLKGPGEIATAERDVKVLETAVYARLDMVRQRILGEAGRTLEQDTRDLFAGWDPIRKEVMGKVRIGDAREAAAIMAGSGADYLARLESKTTQLVSYARNKADSFMTGSGVEYRRILKTLSVASAVIASVFLVIIWLAVNSYGALIKGLQESMDERVALAGKEAESHRRYFQLVEAMNEGVWLQDEKGTTVYVNERLCGMLGYTRTEMMAANVEAFFSGKDFESLKAKGFAGDHTFEIDWRGKGGVRVPSLMSRKPISGLPGEDRGCFSVVTDFSEKKKVEEELAEYRDRLEEKVESRTRALKAAQRELIRNERMAVLGRITATVSHEIRNPLGVISSSVYFLRKVLGRQEDGKVRKHLARIDRQVKECDMIVDELLDYTRGQRVEIATGDINGLVAESMGRIRQADGVRVTRDLSPKLPPVLMDREKMRRVLINLLENAMQAVTDPAAAYGAQEFPAVHVVTERHRDGVAVGVSDNGIGMDDGIRRRVFEPLFTTKAKGTGLGLSVVEKIVAEHGGTVALTSERGEGTCVFMVIPCESKG